MYSTWVTQDEVRREEPAKPGEHKNNDDIKASVIVLMNLYMNLCVCVIFKNKSLMAKTPYSTNVLARLLEGKKCCKHEFCDHFHTPVDMVLAT